MKKLYFLLVVLLVSLLSFSQDSSQEGVREDTLIATISSKATTIKDLKKTFKVTTIDSRVKTNIMRDLGKYLVSVSAVRKEDEKGHYWQYSFHFNPKNKERVLQTIKSY